MARHHLLRDVFWLSLPLSGLVIYLFVTALASYWNAEIVNYHGYPTRSIRVANLRHFVWRATQPVFGGSDRTWIDDRKLDESLIPILDLRVRGSDLDFLDSAMPASAKTWVSAELYSEGGWREVEARHRGQRMGNFFWLHRSWKIKTDRLELWNGYRDINLTPIEGRIENHLSNLVGRRLRIPTPQSRLVHVFVNKEDHGVHLQEEQVDESLMRKSGHMPGDVFYGDLFVPDEPKLGTDEVFCNPYLWTKKSLYNKYPEEFRPHLARFLDLVSNQELESWDRIWDIVDREQMVRYYALICYQGDQHVDKSHNHKLFFNPIAGKFQALPWNVRMNMPRGHGVESMANRFFEKLSRDPRFLDDVHRVIHEELLAGESSMGEEQAEEIARLLRQSAPHALDVTRSRRNLEGLEEIARAREATMRRHHKAAELRYETGPAVAAEEGGADRESVRVARLWCRSTTSLRLRSFSLAEDAPASIRLFERRPAGARRELSVRIDGDLVIVEDETALIHTGRDFSAPYHEIAAEGQNAFQAHRQFTRLAFLPSVYELESEGGAVPDIVGVTARRTVGSGRVSVSAGAPPPNELRSGSTGRGLALGVGTLTTVHPWSIPDPREGVRHHFTDGDQLEGSLNLGPQDRLTIADGATLLLGPDVSIVARSKVELKGVRLRRLDPDRPWGVFALQGSGANGSRLEDCDFEGGSQARFDFVDYTGMLSVYEADEVALSGGRYAANLLGDDTVRYARCDGILIENITVSQANGDAIDCDISSGEIRGCTIEHPHNDGIDLMTANVNISDCRVVGAGDKGISLGESANPVVRNVHIEDCVTGIAIKDASDPLIVDSRVLGCKTGVSAYDKNWRYPGGGRGRLRRCTIRDNDIDLKMDASSLLTLEDTPITGPTSLPGPFEDSVRVEAVPAGGLP